MILLLISLINYKMKNKKTKKAQMKISYNLIFSIILIVIFIVFAAFAITKFIENKEFIKAEKIEYDIQVEINKLKTISSSSIEKGYNVPKEIEEICFEQQPQDSELPNMYSLPEKIISEKLINVDWSKTNPSGEKLCIPAYSDDKIYLWFKKDYGDELITIKNPEEFFEEEIEIRLGEVDIPKGSVSATFNDLNYAIIGDSMSDSFSNDWIGNFADKSSLSENDFNILANPGDSCADVYNQLNEVSDNTDVLFSSCGVNGFAGNDNKKWWEDIYNKAKEKEIKKIYMITMPPWDNLKNDIQGCNKMKSENQWLINFASDKEDLIVIDLWTMWHDSTGTSNTNCGWHSNKDLSDDGVHPNSKANQEWGEEYYDEVKKYVDTLKISTGSGSQTQGNNYGNLQSKTCGDFEIYFQNDFEDNKIGSYSNFNEFRKEWNCGGANRWEYTKIFQGIGDNPTKSFEIVFPFYDIKDFKWSCWCDTRCEAEDGSGARKVFDKKMNFGCPYKLTGVGPGSGGASFKVDLPSKEVLYLSYKIRFGEDFYPVDGGKLPGFCGGTCPGGGGDTDKDGDGTSDGFSARLMWGKQKEDGTIGGKFYVYHPTREIKYGSSQGFSRGFHDGEWYTIVQRVQMNDLNQDNGRLTAWIDGRLVTDKSGYIFRKGSSENFAIDKIMFANFFGGSGERMCKDRYIESGEFQCDRYSDGSPYKFYAPRKDEYIYFDDIVVYYPNSDSSYKSGEVWPPDLSTC